MKPLAPPQNLADLLSDPQRIRDAFELLSALAALQVHLVPPGNVAALAPGNRSIIGDPPNLILPLPLKFTTAIANSSATAASVSTQLNLLLAELRKTGQLPS